MHKLQTPLARLALTTLIPLIIILGSFSLTVFNKDFYHKEADKNKVHENIENSKELTTNVIEYLKEGKALDAEAFTEDEMKHLEEVRTLARTTLYTLYALIALTISLAAYLLIKNKAIAFSTLYHAGIATAAASITLILLLSFAFDQTFTAFHNLLFRNELWILPAESTLIRLFPKEFFTDFAIKIALNSIIISILLILTGRAKRK